MSLPHPSSEPDAGGEEEFSRITVLVGRQLIDVGVDAGLGVSVVANDVIELAELQPSVPTDPMIEYGSGDDKWTLARLTGAMIDPDQSLAEADVRDGEILMIQPTDAPESSILVDSIADNAEMRDAGRSLARGAHATTAWLLFGGLVSLLPTLTLSAASRPSSIVTFPVAVVLAFVVGIACVASGWILAYRPKRRRLSAGLCGLGLPLILAAGFLALPGSGQLAALSMALAIVGAVAVLQLLITDLARAAHTAIICLAAVGAPAMAAQMAWGGDPAVAGSIIAAGGVLTVYLAPRVTILLSRLPIPRVPTAGEPLDEIETEGGTNVEGVNALGKQVIPTEEGMAQRVGRATEHLTGIVAATTILVIAGCFLTLDPHGGLSWQKEVFVAAAATALCLRGRSHHNVVQSALLIAGGLAIALISIIRMASSEQRWQVACGIALVVLASIVAVCGLVAPRLDFSPVMRRWVEIGEYLSIGLLFPLLCSVTNLYGVFRGLRL
ncbi:type VII secretion integral membrane protein EccD [Mycobacterium sp. 3519A]|uniref:type VII secretion integral membrane protein EccD n=1 Tax=Mycobacterium sp. 3519A TaxID=2057184 RepID=UPI0013570F42|nr:type VII secretion integral membrane protein EccD [Mycobacterium sp. 3519A]